MKILIDIPEETYEYWKEHAHEYVLAEAITHGVVIPQGHGKIVDLKQIREDMTTSDNPVITINLNPEFIEAVSLDYLNSLPAIVEADDKEA